MADINADTFINNMFGELMYQIVNGQAALPPGQQTELAGKKPFSGANFFTWCTPGIPVVADDFAFLKGTRKPLDYTKYKDLTDAEKEALQGSEAYQLTVAMDNFSVLVDTVPGKEGMMESLQVWEPNQRISHIYESVLNGCEVADTVPTADAAVRIKKILEATVETVEKVDADTSEKFTEERPSRMVMAYNKYMQEYSTSYGAYIDLMNKSLTGGAGDVQRASMMGPQYYKAVTTAFDLWESAGHKTEYEKMMADLVQLEGISMSMLLKEYRDIFAKTRRESFLDSSSYNVSRVVPASFADSTGWTNYSFNSSKLKSTDLSKSQEYSGGARYGIFGGGRGNYKKVESASQLSFENVSISFDLGQFPIVRNWFREDFLLSTKWRIKSGLDTGSVVNSGDLLSNGNPTNPEGKLFAYPTVMIVAKNIRISKDIYQKISDEATKSGSGGGALNIGFLSIGAKGSYNTSERNLDVKEDGSDMLVPGMQIVGFRNHQLNSKVPNPDAAITNWI